ncbi:hypothetical protein [Poseidonocella sp. HB161398]|uniref:hypothetical protein n=1 Tax=Poseidonocella sp. HB161398 TaxID=2320855 RepID=UPI0014870FAB|nr:hypothetical protein [Poseidonocella sp. HB161398]
MSMLRTALIHLLLVALLPWGAWVHAARAAEAGPLRVYYAERAETRSQAAQKTLSTLTRCRISGLPGTSCGFDPGHLAGAGTSALPRPPVPRPAADLRLGDMHDPSGPLDPPRRG